MNQGIGIEGKQPERKFEIKLCDNNLTAYVIVKYTDGIKYAPRDNDASKKDIVDNVLECPKFTLEEARDILKSQGIVYGINEENLSYAISSGTDTPVEIAKGVRPIDAVDDRIEAKFDDNKKFEEINDRVDFYSIGKVVSVEPGMLVAEVIKGSEGKPGMDVRGNEIKYKKGKKITLKAGRGVKISEDGLKAYSDIWGRPEIKGDIVSVHEVYEVKSDVNIATGNIDFVGDIIIKGNVTEGMKVKAGNSVVVYGSVTSGEITAGGDVTVHKNIISSKIRAGCNDFVRYNIIELFDKIEKKLSGLFSAAVTLKETGKVPKIYKDGQIIKLLVDTKFNDLNIEINKLRNILAENKEYVDTNTIRTGATMIKYFTGKGPTLIENCFIIKDFSKMLCSQIEELKGQLKEPTSIRARYVQNSELTTSGDIIIEGKGCYTSELRCRGNVTIERIGSVTRGGSIEAGGDIRIYELGSPVGALTTVSTGKDAAVYCEIAHINSVIKVGQQSMALGASYKKLKAYIYKGELLIEKSKIVI